MLFSAGVAGRVAMTDRDDQHAVVELEMAIERDVTGAAARNDALAQAFLRRAAERGALREVAYRRCDERNRVGGQSRIVGLEVDENVFQVCERSRAVRDL